MLGKKQVNEMQTHQCTGGLMQHELATHGTLPVSPLLQQAQLHQ
jgi:hypothetical protein